jgi:hypothetical protein
MSRCLLFILLSVPCLFAQTASLRGTVTDPSGAVIPAAVVTLTAPDGSTKTANTDKNGFYSFTGLATGTYSASATAPQLSQAQPSTISVRPGVQTF